MTNLHEVVEKIFNSSEAVVEGVLTKNCYEASLGDLFKELKYPGMLPDWSKEFKFVVEELNKLKPEG